MLLRLYSRAKYFLPHHLGVCDACSCTCFCCHGQHRYHCYDDCQWNQFWRRRGGHNSPGSTCKKGNTKNKDGFWQTKAVGTSTTWAKQKLTKHSQTQVHRDNVSDESAVASAGAQQGFNAAGSAEDSSLVAGLKRQATWFCSLPQLKLHPENLLSRKTSFRTNWAEQSNPSITQSNCTTTTGVRPWHTTTLSWQQRQRKLWNRYARWTKVTECWACWKTCRRSSGWHGSPRRASNWNLDFHSFVCKEKWAGPTKEAPPLCGDVNLNVKSVPFSSYERLPSDLEGAYKELYNDDVLLDSLGGALMQPVSLPWGESGWHVFCLDTSTPKAIGNPNHTSMSGGQVVWATAGATHKFYFFFII